MTERKNRQHRLSGPRVETPPGVVPPAVPQGASGSHLLPSRVSAVTARGACLARQSPSQPATHPVVEVGLELGRWFVASACSQSKQAGLPPAFRFI